MRAAGRSQSPARGSHRRLSADYIAFHAAERPDAVALIAKQRAITYAEFDRDLRRFTHALRELELARGQTVAVACDDLYVHWLLLLALERLRIATMSYLSSERETYATLLASVDLVVSEPDSRPARARRHFAITAQWLSAVFAGTDEEQEVHLPEAPDDAVRLVRTSGTTGESKRLLLRRSVQDAWIDRWAWFLTLTRDRRYLVTMPFAVNAIYTVARAFIRAGGSVAWDLFEDTAAILRALSQGITDIVVLPIQLKQILDALPEDFEKPANLTVTVIGAAAPEVLRKRAMMRLASEVIVGYGANEMPFMTELRESCAPDTGLVLPWVEIEVVDEDDKPLPNGSLGRIRARTAVMADGYLDDPQATERMFRGGWFYPGDVGVLEGARRLHVAGRSDELMNIGGGKFSPSALEGLVLEHVRAGDVGVCSVPGPGGLEEVCVAVVDPEQTDQELLNRISLAFSAYALGAFHVVKLDRIPRNPVGKIQREPLKRAVASRLRKA